MNSTFSCDNLNFDILSFDISDLNKRSQYPKVHTDVPTYIWTERNELSEGKLILKEVNCV
jgi:hypothetical protein